MNRVILNLRIALRSLCSFKLRTILAVLGVFLGTLSLILVSNLTKSLQLQTDLTLDKFGKNMLIVRSGLMLRHGGGARHLSDATNLTLADADAILENCPAVSAVSPASNKQFPLRYGDIVLGSILVTGAWPNFPQVRSFHPAEGTFFTEYDNDHLNRVVVLGKKVADKLFAKESPLGKHILVWRIPCQVIGVMEEKGVDIANADQDNQIFIPVKTYLRRFVNKDHINSIHVRTVDAQAIPAAISQIEAALRQRHKIQPGQKDDFTVLDMKDVMFIKSQATALITVLGRISAVVSFAIGALGILSIMILIVNERRIEIGIRRAVGSRKRDIVLQFLMESSFISFSGGMVGVAFGLLVSVIVFSLTSLPFAISPVGILTSFATSVAVGILAGIYPSQRAVAIQPIDVIRS